MKSCFLHGLCQCSDSLGSSAGVQSHHGERREGGEQAPTHTPLPFSLQYQDSKRHCKGSVRAACFCSFSSRVVRWKSCLFSTLVVPIMLPSASSSPTCTSRPYSMSPERAPSLSKTSTATSGSLWRTATRQTSARTSRKPLTSLVGALGPQLPKGSQGLLKECCVPTAVSKSSQWSHESEAQRWWGKRHKNTGGCWWFAAIQPIPTGLLEIMGNSETKLMLLHFFVCSKMLL